MIPTQSTQQIHSPQHQVRTISFTPGQIFQGKVLKLFPNHLASLQINGMKMTGVLEASLIAGERYWFEVKESKGLPRLKVLEYRSNQSKGANQQKAASIADLLRHLGASHIKEAETVITAFQRQGLSFSREMIQASSQLLNHSSLPSDKTMKLIGQMVQRNLPLTPAVFDAYWARGSTGELSEQLQALIKLLGQSSDSRSKQWLQQVQSIMQASTLSKSAHSPIQQLLITALSEGGKEEQSARMILQRLGVHLNQEELIQALRAQQSYHALGHTEANVGEGRQRNEFTTFISQMRNSEIEMFIRQISNHPSLHAMESRLSSLHSEALSQGERQLLMQLYGGERSRMQMPQFQLLGSLLGFDYEQVLTKHLQANELAPLTIAQQNLKALLLSMQQQNGRTDLQTVASTIVNKLTAQQLLSHEQLGSFHQYIFSIPLQLGAFHTNMTMQWEGQKNEDGQLNPDYCRILFYLTLEHLQETVVDVMIQNRIVSVTIHNEQDQPHSLLSLLTPTLKNALQQKEYQLLSVNWKKLNEVEQKQQTNDQNYSTYRGVDIRI
ncbi:hypothetical protein [Halalkalibacter hemicellulosilyticus]|uniref:Flagellar hook-length control protein-like C-terminal domain-containing protein n=1 Tax=Halalkalibacter hemicellulosilyticusJCM 9152 TaxID=1236971 RepID=W4QB79_9BACI|nr:hypothetical protein [Halalkalibacter hemicellulosilyticus]GAE29227.1 hypothetical protein JCM9152_572 [Halalkalibacter hemicellulosilyticusJCM 9152]